MVLKLNNKYPFKVNQTGEVVNDSTVLIKLEENALIFEYDIFQNNKVYSPFKKDNDPIYNGDVVEVFISFDNRNDDYLEYELSPTGLKFLGHISNPTLESPILTLIEPKFDSIVELTNYGYKASISVDLPPNFDINNVLLNCFNINTEEGTSQKLFAISPTMCGSFHKSKYFVKLEK